MSGCTGDGGLGGADDALGHSCPVAFRLSQDSGVPSGFKHWGAEIRVYAPLALLLAGDSMLPPVVLGPLLLQD